MHSETMAYQPERRTLVHRCQERCRNWLMNTACALDRVLFRFQAGNGGRATADITWRDHVTWWAQQHITSRLFAWGFFGSDEEIRSVFDGETPLGVASERQLAALRSRPPLECYCASCEWVGCTHSINQDGTCPTCSDKYVYCA